MLAGDYRCHCQSSVSAMAELHLQREPDAFFVARSVNIVRDR